MKDRDSFKFGVELKTRRMRGNLGIHDLVMELGVSTSTFLRWERGEVRPRFIHIRRLIEFFLRADSFTKGRELEEAKRFWELGEYYELFDEEWFRTLLKERTTSSPISVFCCYASEDEMLQRELKMHLSFLQRQGVLWSSGKIVAGQEWRATFNTHLAEASVILLLISPNFLASDYIYSKEMLKALERHEAGEARVIPILLRSANWEGSYLDSLQALPRDGKSVTGWKDKDEGFTEISRGIRLIIEDLREQRIFRANSIVPETHAIRSPRSSSPTYPLYEVFKQSGVPQVTFVEREDFEHLKLSLAQPGRGVVIEGPSGIGKTTAVEKAVEALLSRRRLSRTKATMQILSARNPEHRSQLQTLPQWHIGTIIVDDFHRLDPQQQEALVDYLKYLADTEPASKKLVIVGIPRTGQSLVDASFDLATRIDVFKLGLVSDELLQHMIEKGEEALNIAFDRKADIVIASSGSLNVAQLLCFHLCKHQKLIETQKQFRKVSCDVDVAVNDVMKSLSQKFKKSVKHFAAMGGSRNSISLAFLDELTGCEDGFLSLSHLKGTQPEKIHSIERFLNEGWMHKLYSDFPDCANHIFFDPMAQALVIDDPQLAFYLKKISLTALSREAGKSPALAQRKVFISYSRKDRNWLERLRVHLSLLEREGIVELWDDTKITAGAQWKEAIQEALDTSRVAVALVSADFLASDFISQHELPALLSQAASGGTVIIPIIISPCLFANSGLSRFQTVNTPDKPLSAMRRPEQERILVNVAEVISKRLLADEI